MRDNATVDVFFQRTSRNCHIEIHKKYEISIKYGIIRTTSFIQLDNSHVVISKYDFEH